MVRKFAVLALIGAAVATACDAAESSPPLAVDPPAKSEPATASTIARADYIGPDECGECHRDQLAAWRRSLHATMNQLASPTSIIGDFANVTVRYRDGTVRLTGDGGDKFSMTFERAGQRVRYRVTRTIGTRGLQEYVGVADGDATNREVRLPLGWWPGRAGWYPQPYYDPWLTEAAFDPFTPVGEPWSERCPWCHSTYPFSRRIARSQARAIGHGLEQWFALDPSPNDTGSAGPVEAVSEQVTVGISCESCHLGGRAHAAGAPIHFVPLGARPLSGAPPPTTFAEERADPAIVNQVCAQCHSGPSPRYPNGGASRNSSEALDLAASRCRARCVDCHDPHTGGSDRARALSACAGCHADRTTATHRQHAQATADCIDCHMPKIVLGIAGHVRSHRISSPTDPAMFAAGVPNACNLCHLDQSIDWTRDSLARDFAAPMARSDHDREPARDGYLASANPAIRLVAAAALADHVRATRDREAWRALVDLLDDRLPHVRAYATFAVEQALGRRLRDDEYDPRAPARVRQPQLVRLARYRLR